ncbi:MAG TPA: hypothetical protein VJV78_26925 [Polyangiales bacterium]|nr:hypothetical protein [Polyangiales bacterium]
MNPSLLIIERPGSFRDALVSEIELTGAKPHVRDDAMDALATLRELRPNLVLVSEDPGPPGASSVCRLVRRSVDGAAVYRLGDPSQRDLLDDQSPFVPRAIGAPAIARFLLQRAENNTDVAPPERVWDAPVASLELGPLLLAVSQRWLTGRLTLHSQSWERELHFVRGSIVASRSSMYAERLGQVALRAGLLTQPQLDSALDHSRSSERRLGEALLDLGILDGQKLFIALCAQLMEQVAVACNNGACHARFVLDEGVIGNQLALRLHPITALLHAVRRTPKEDIARVLDQLADRQLAADGVPETVLGWLASAGVSEPAKLLGSIGTVRHLRDRLRERLGKPDEMDSDAVVLALLRVGACKLPGRASLVPSDLRTGMSTLAPPSVASAVVRCARASFENWPISALGQARTPFEQTLDAYLSGSRPAESLRGPAAEVSEVDAELLAQSIRAAGNQQRRPGAWLPLAPTASAREVRLACHAALVRLDERDETFTRPIDRLRSAELRRQLERSLRMLDAGSAPEAAASAPTAKSPSGETKPAAVSKVTHAGDPVLLSQVEPLIQAGRWQELRNLLASQDEDPSNLPPAFALLYAIALKEVAGDEQTPSHARGNAAEALGIAAVSEMLSVPAHSATALVVAKRALRRRPIEWTRKASGRASLFFVLLALLCGAGVGLFLSPQLMHLFMK